MADTVRVLVAAAGSGSRMKKDINKQYLLLNSRPILAYCLEFFEHQEAVQEIVIMTGAHELEYCAQEIVQRLGYKKVSAILPGGKERQDSVWLGLQSLAKGNDLVAVHDGARPLLSANLFARVLEAAREWGAAIPGVASKETLKTVDRDGFVGQTLERSSVFAIQTPQIFNGRELIKAYRLAREEGFLGTDDASLFERYIGKVKVVEGDYRNLKITTPEDLVIAEALLRT